LATVTLPSMGITPCLHKVAAAALRAGDFLIVCHREKCTADCRFHPLPFIPTEHERQLSKGFEEVGRHDLFPFIQSRLDVLTAVSFVVNNLSRVRTRLNRSS
ncbi:MAG: hypothetical protein Q8N96_14125, partial [Methylovulum sp.]|nr:hypothetical protein [Methylovulum sp.]